jgi:hypothetical protein
MVIWFSDTVGFDVALEFFWIILKGRRTLHSGIYFLLKEKSINFLGKETMMDRAINSQPAGVCSSSADDVVPAMGSVRSLLLNARG